MPARPAHAGRALRPLAAATLGALVFASPALAAGASAVVEVRIEGRTSTLFEGPLRTEGHAVRASSDLTERPCDGTNNGAHSSPGPTPTAAAADAMTLSGQTFDGRWFGSIDDYLVERWGPEAAGEGQSWSLFSNDVLSNVGGCQLVLREGAQVLWKLGFPTAKPLLMLAPRGTSTAAPPLAASANPGVPFGVEVLSYHPAAESEPPSEPSRAGASAASGATVAPVLTSSDGSETVLEEDPARVSTNAEGVASITFAEPGWHRLKAVATGAVRSNRLDVCVAAPGSGCGPLPAEDDIRSATASEVAAEAAPPPLTPGGAPGRDTTGTSAAPPPPAGGTAPAHAADVLLIAGLALAPIDDRAGALRFRGGWRRSSERGAWQGTLTVGGTGARLRVHLGKGRPMFVLRDVPRTATISERAGGHARVVRFGPLPAGASGLLRMPRLTEPGSVELRVLRGEIGVDGVAIAR